jgi:protein-tyrosine phosphatase
MSDSDPRYHVLFVCTGNTCRSPLAAGALLDALGPDRDRVRVSSAGTAAWVGQPASEAAVQVAARDGVDLREHRSRRATPDMVRSADLILVMERVHLAPVLSLGADAGRTHVLSDWPEPGEAGLVVSDPYGGSMEAYEETWRRIRRHLERIVPAVHEALRTRST